jgi:hypothetical protein
MYVTTQQRDHWILDRSYSDMKEFPYDYKLFIEALQSKIQEGLAQNCEVYIPEECIIESFDFNLRSFLSLQRPDFKNNICNSQDWIGYVIKIGGDGFEAKLIDKNQPGTYENASFDFKEISNEDKELIKIGAIFYWSVGYADINGQITKISLVRFKRSIEFSESEFDGIMDRADELSKKIRWL